MTCCKQPEAGKPKGGRKPAKKAVKKATPAKKAASKPKADRTNKKAEVIAMMERAKGATLDEIMKATGWQRHTVRGFVSILGSKGGQKIESSKNAACERTYKIAKWAGCHEPGMAFLLLYPPLLIEAGWVAKTGRPKASVLADVGAESSPRCAARPCGGLVVAAANVRQKSPPS